MHSTPYHEAGQAKLEEATVPVMPRDVIKTSHQDVLGHWDGGATMGAWWGRYQCCSNTPLTPATLEGTGR